MSPAPGAERPAPTAESGLSSAAGGFAASATRFLRAFTALFGLELRETGEQALWLAGLVVGFIVAGVFAYLFLLLGISMALANWLGGGWMGVLLGLFGFHLIMAGVLLGVLIQRARQPLFPGTREALQREMDKLS
jgi:urea transporter